MNTNLDSNIFNKLSENAKVALRNAAQISSQLDSKDIKPLHIFTGILLNKQSLAVRILTTMGLNTSEILFDFSDFVGITIDVKTSHKPMKLYFSEESAEIIREAFLYANQLSHVYVGTEHIVSSILANSKLDFVKRLESKGLKYESYQNALLSQATYPEGLLMKKGKVEGEEFQEETTLGVLGYDLVEAAKRGEFDPLIGREKELDSVVKVLSRRKKNNPVIIGEAGVGKTALVEGLAQRIAKGNVPPPLLNMRIFSLDIPTIIANSKLRGDIEEKVLAIIREVLNSPDIIVFIDEIHSILSASMPGSGVDIGSVLKPALLKDRFRCIGATTTEAYMQYFDEDSALARRFQPIKLEEPSLEDTEKILRQIKKLVEKHQKVSITPEAIKAAVILSDRYISDRYLPDKAIDLLDEAAATKRMDIESKYKVVSKLYYKYKNRYLTYGIEGLKDKIKATPVMPNATKKKTVEKVLTVAKKYPTYGPARLANELGNIVCSATVYNILRRHNLSKKLDRLLSLEEIPSSIKISPILARKLEAQNPSRIFSPRPGHILRPGYMLSVDTFYVCTLKGVGRIYQFTAIDTNSSFGTAYLYADKSAASAVDFIARTIAIFKALAIAISSVLTDNGKEYTSHWKGPHIFEDYLSKRNIKHRYTKVRCPWTNGYAERFNRTLLEEFYQPALMRKNYSSIKELQADLDRYLYFYNFQRTHQGYRLKGKKPCEKLLTVSDLKALTG